MHITIEQVLAELLTETRMERDAAREDLRRATRRIDTLDRDSKRLEQKVRDTECRAVLSDELRIAKEHAKLLKQTLGEREMRIDKLDLRLTAALAAQGQAETERSQLQQQLTEMRRTWIPGPKVSVKVEDGDPPHVPILNDDNHTFVEGESEGGPRRYVVRHMEVDDQLIGYEVWDVQEHQRVDAWLFTDHKNMGLNGAHDFALRKAARLNQGTACTL